MYFLISVSLSFEDKEDIINALESVIPEESMIQFQNIDVSSKEFQLEQLFLLCLGILILKSFIKKDFHTKIKFEFLTEEIYYKFINRNH